MSKGTKVTAVRLPPSLVEACRLYLAERRKNPSCDEWTMSDLIIHALADYLKWVVRGRRSVKTPRQNQDELSGILAGIEGIILTNPDREEREQS